MPRFRKKPVVIEARLYGECATCDARTADWCGGAIFDDRLLIDTLEGTMTAEPGDWIIRGVKGEFYPCKPDIFKQTYEAVPDGEVN